MRQLVSILASSPALTSETGFKMSATTREQISKIQKVDTERQIVYGVVYAPLEIDTWGELMTAEDIETLAHRFMSLKLNETIDEMHDEQGKQNVYPIESFIAREDDPDYPEGSWVLAVKIEDENTWAKVKSGELNGFSFQALVKKVAAVVEIEYDPEIIGWTGEAVDHRHLYYAKLDEDGKVVAGRTSTELGHSHEIKKGTATEMGAGHAHRFFI